MQTTKFENDARLRHNCKPTAVDLYCGVGGLSLGLVEAGFDLRGAIDNNSEALTAYGRNFRTVKTANFDLSKASGAEIRSAIGLGHNEAIDLLVGGPPCQGFSDGGTRDMHDSRNEGVLVFARLVAELQPRFFVMENVRGFLASKHAPRRRRFSRIVHNSGYQIRLPIQTLNAADFGVPQRRVRAFVIGSAANEPLPHYPQVSSIPKTTVADAIQDLALLDIHSDDFDSDQYAGPYGVPSEYAKTLRRRRNGKTVTKISGCLRSHHSTVVIDRFQATQPGDQESISRYYRLAWSGVSPTLRAGTGPEHGSHTAPRPIHPSRARCITVREAARLHSFPDWFEFDGTRWHGFRQIGNSVPPLLAKAVFGQILQLCKGKTQ